MSDMPDSFKPRGALLECLKSFPQFQKDLEILIREGFIRITSPSSCEWLKTKTSLAEYFKWACGDAKGISGGFWAPIGNAFGKKQRNLSRLAGHNANPIKPDKSKDFIRLKAVLQPLRIQEEKKQNELQAFRNIKRLILSEGKDEEPEAIHRVLEKISEFITGNVDKNGQSRR